MKCPDCGSEMNLRLFPSLPRKKEFVCFECLKVLEVDNDEV